MRTFAPTLHIAGRLCFAAAVAFFGIQQLIHQDFVTRALPPPPDGLPLRVVWVNVLGTLLIAGAVGMLWRRSARRAAIVVATIVLAAAVLVHLPVALASATTGYLWTNLGKGLALGGAALLMASNSPIDPDSPTDRLFVITSRVTFGAFLVLCGVQHFAYLDFVRTLVPSWAGFPVFWSAVAGIALIVAGFALALGSRLAALFAGFMVFFWVWSVHLPRALTMDSANETTALFEALAFSALGWMLASPAARAPSAPPSRDVVLA